MIKWQIGCSGFYYSEWKKIFYPESLLQRKWFEFYTDHFNTVEINVTFYRFPKLEFFQSWYERSPADFTFSIKAPRLITHYKRFMEAQLLVEDFYARIKEGLREKATCVLFQFPASFIFEQQALDRIVSLLDKSFNNVLEFRHGSWWQESVYKVLRKNNITFCGMSHPSLPKDIVRTSDSIYYRFHGVPKLYYSKYETEELQQIMNTISNMTTIEQACLYFNNTASGSAIANAKQLQEFCHVMDLNK